MAAANSAARTAEISGRPQGHGLRFDGLAGRSEFEVEKASCIAVPFGGGNPVAGFGLKEHDDFKGSPEQPSVKVRFDPGAARSVRLIMTLCPAITGVVDETGANPARFTVSLTGNDVLVT